MDVRYMCKGIIISVFVKKKHSYLEEVTFKNRFLADRYLRNLGYFSLVNLSDEWNRRKTCLFLVLTSSMQLQYAHHMLRSTLAQ